MNTAVLLELHYLPCIQYFSKLARYPAAYIEQWENYQKGSYRNRCHIAGANGLLRLSIPLRQGKNEQQPIREVEIAYKEPWRAQHWASIRSAYGNAPFFEYYAGKLRPHFEEKPIFLFDFAFGLLQTLVGLVRPGCELRPTDAYVEEPPGHVLDLRGAIHPKKHRRRADPDFQPASYPQVFLEKHGFLPNLSILDLLFCSGPQAGLILEESFVKS
ncbi:MAG: WbqC family protein [Phaeodactylibacter sp.]|nr:WbqC family protein [Phaeodactylibacter sp.]MCB9293808.1 WbqC family protein [Lewinellaceae bacterium]